MPEVFKIRGLVLREVNVGEADKLLTVLTADRGKLTVRAFGARNIRSRRLAATRTLCYDEMDIAVSQSGLRLSDITLINGFYGLNERFEALSLAQYFAQITDSLTGDELADDGMLSLMLNALYALCERLYDDSRIKACFELRAMKQCGYRPSIAVCGRCSRAISPDDGAELSFDIRGGSMLCHACTEAMGVVRGAGTGQDAAQGAGYDVGTHAVGYANDTIIALPYATLLAMRHVLTCPIKRLFSFKLDDAASDALNVVCERYICEQLDTLPNSLVFYKSILGLPRRQN